MAYAATPTDEYLQVPRKNELLFEETALTGQSREFSTSSIKRGRRISGWRTGVAYAIVLITVVLLINLSFLIWAVASRGPSLGISTLQRGSCETSTKINTWIHLVINILSTGMLGASNYCEHSVSRWRFPGPLTD